MRRLLLREGVRLALVLLAVGLAGASVITDKSGLMYWALLAAGTAAVLNFIVQRRRPRKLPKKFDEGLDGSKAWSDPDELRKL